MWTDPSARTLTFGEYVPQFNASRRNRRGKPVTPKTRELSEGHFRRVLVPAFGEAPLNRITSRAVDEWHASLPYKRDLKCQLYSLLRAVLNMAVRDGLIRSNPCTIVGAGSVAPSNRPPVTLAQVEAIIRAMRDPERLAAVLGLGTPMRRGELLALRWMDVDLDGRTVHVSRSVTDSYNGAFESTTKTGRSRTVAISDETADVLRALPEGRGAQRVLRRADGSELRGYHVTAAWNAARQAVGLEHARFHDIRHAGLTALAYEGLPMRAIMARAGHTTTAAALVYQHAAEALRHEDADALVRALERSRRRRG